jgi:hypothetical protein
VQQLTKILAIVGAFSVLLLAVQPSAAFAQTTIPIISSSGQMGSDSGSSQATQTGGQRMRGPAHDGDHLRWGHGHHGHGLTLPTWSNPFWPWWAGMPIAQISALTGFTWPYPLFPMWPAPFPFWGF